jgi:outer membrane protein, multidrug efflux system
MGSSRLTGAILLVALAGCLAPHYERPEAPVAPAFPSVSSAAAAPSVAVASASTVVPSELGWRDVFGDPRLTALVALSLKQNRDLRTAALNVELTQAQYRIQRAQQLPQLYGNASVVRQRTPADLNTTGHALLGNDWSVGLGLASFELDFFGRVRNLSEAALEQYFATEEARRAAQISLVAAVAEEYLTTRALEDQVALAQNTLDTVAASLDLTRRATQAGRVGELDLRTAESQVETARFNLAAAKQQRAQAENALVLLVGGPLPTDLPAPLPLDAQPVVADLPAGVPSEVLVRRPDVLAAEHALISANALIGAARAAFFPSISLTAFGGTASASLDHLFGTGSSSWSFSPHLNIPIFAGGALKASLDVAEVRKSIEIAQYERAVQGAFREVADGLVSRAFIDEQLKAQSARVEAEARRYQLSELRYRSGLDSYLTLLTAQRDFYGAQQQLIQTRLARLTNLVDLYKALGGGWRERTATPSGT